MKIELTNEQLTLLETLLLGYIKDRKAAASESQHDEEVHDFFIKRAEEADLLYQAIKKQREQ